MPADTPIPDIPGALLTNPAIRHHLNQHVGNLCGLHNGKFPGSQPVSFSSASLDLLEKRDFWVCEKSDGVRVLLFVVMNGASGGQECWLIDRKQNYYLVDGLNFAHWERLSDPLTDTVIDGELVIDVDPATGAHVLRYYAFDCLVLHGENIMQKPLIKRYARLRDWFIAPIKKAQHLYPEWKTNAPFDIVAKLQELSYSTAQVLNVHIPNLQHGHDGLIFTCAESVYAPGTDENILKWKPPGENSIDFKLELRFPPHVDDPNQVDLFAKPTFLLNEYFGGDAYEFFDEMEVDDDEWELLKEAGEGLDDRLVEVCWDMERNAWRMMRFRDDKPHGNFHTVVRKVLESIADGVEIDQVLSRQDAIRTAWKQREKQRNRPPPPPAGQPQHKPKPHPQVAAVPGLRR